MTISRKKNRMTTYLFTLVWLFIFCFHSSESTTVSTWSGCDKVYGYVNMERAKVLWPLSQFQLSSSNDTTAPTSTPGGIVYANLISCFALNLNDLLPYNGVGTQYVGVLGEMVDSSVDGEVVLRKTDDNGWIMEGVYEHPMKQNGVSVTSTDFKTYKGVFVTQGELQVPDILTALQSLSEYTNGSASQLTTIIYNVKRATQREVSLKKPLAKENLQKNQKLQRVNEQKRNSVKREMNLFSSNRVENYEQAVTDSHRDNANQHFKADNNKKIANSKNKVDSQSNLSSAKKGKNNVKKKDKNNVKKKDKAM
jgi:hypothetical protein